MKLEVGMYVRTDLGEIGKITSVSNSLKDLGINGIAYNSEPYLRGNETKTSHNIIEVGDYVNGSKVTLICEDKVHPQNKCLRIYGRGYVWQKGIKSIVTKECFESMSYKVGGKEC